ncbi:MAG: sodium:solute symporter [Calditrichaeota bacterium]|nr:sodium:solute symporter [Calditrichota bacterium]
MGSFGLLDTLVLLAYLAVVLAVGLIAAGRRSFSVESVDGYFLAGRRLGWFTIGASLFATNISSEHFLGLADYGAKRGLVVGNIEWMAIFFLMWLGWFLAPVLLGARVYTLPEFLGKRFGTSVRNYLAVISIAVYIVTKISIALFAGGVLMESLFGWDVYTSAIILMVITGLYTIVGGMPAVVYTSVVQAFFLITGAFLITAFGLLEVGGWSGLRAQLPESYFHLIKPISDPDFPWTGIVFGAPILGIWYWCTDQYILQRIFAARDERAARYGAVFTGFLKILPMFILVLPGLVAAVLFPDLNGLDALPRFLASEFLPAGIRGLAVTAVLAALMSSLASSFHSAATLFAMDLYRTFNPGATERKLVLVGRLAAMVLVLIGILWIPLTRSMSSDLYLQLQGTQAYISPPVVAVFLAGLFFPMVNGRAARITLIAGGLVGLLRMGWDFFRTLTGTLLSWLDPVMNANFLHFAVFLFAFSMVILVLASLLPGEKEGRVPGRWRTDMTTNLGVVVNRNRGALMLSAALLILVAGLWAQFL